MKKPYNKPVLKRKKVPIGSKPMSYYWFKNHNRVLGTTLRAASSSMHYGINTRTTISQEKVLSIRDEVEVVIFLRDPLERMACAYALFKGAYDFAEWSQNAINKYNAHWAPQTDIHSFQGVFLPNKVLLFDKLNDLWKEMFPDHPLIHSKDFPRKSWDELVGQLSMSQLNNILDFYEDDIELYRKLVVYNDVQT